MKRLMVLFFALAFVGAAWVGEWHIETVDPEGAVGQYTSLALDSSGYPHISYQDYDNNNLKYAYWNGSSWRIETVDSSVCTGFDTSLVLDSSDYPRIAYCDVLWNYLRYAHWDGTSWQIETVDSAKENLGMDSLALDSFEYPHISYWDNTNNDLKYAHWDGDEWLRETVDSWGNVGYYNSLALDDRDHPLISYCLYSLYEPDNLKYAHWDGDRWQIETVDWVDLVGAFTSLELDSSGYPRIAYCDLTHYTQKYAWWDGDTWQIETVDDDGSVGWYASLALDSSDNPHISYLEYIEDDSNLKYTRWDGASWQTETVDTEGDVGWDTSLALDEFDNPHISYHDWTNHDLKYAWFGDVTEVESAEVFANTCDEGILVGWTITGDTPASFSVLRSAGVGKPAAISGALPGTATRWLDTGVKAGIEYRYWLEATDADGSVSRFGPTEPVNFPGAARELDLAIYPSPASGSFTVDYTLPENGRISISLYDLSGRRVSTVFDVETTTGRHDVSFDASALPPGVYLARLATDSGTLTRRVVITR